MGRPSRAPDPRLAARVQARLVETGTSLRALAIDVGCTASTLSRSLSTEAFSSDVGGRLAVWLDGGEVRLDAKLALHKLLQDLTAERRIRAKVEAALKLALDRLEEAG